MSYLVLARKHRPATFEEVVGQEHVSRTLAGALASGRLAHAFCFTGPRGVGKTSVARILAKAFNCVEGPTPTPCGVCVHCREIDEGRALDVQEIDAASNSRVEDVRELREMIRFRPQSSRFRVTILDEVHMLSKAAFNALLKTLEEPPEHAAFILATTDVHKVPLTILSRCQRYDFRRLPPKLLAGHMRGLLEKEGFSLPEESLALIAREADGSVRDSLSLLDQVLSLGRAEMTHPEVVELLGLVDRELVYQTAAAVLAGDAGAVLDLISQVYAAGGEMTAFYGALQEHLRNLAAAKAAPAGAELFGLSEEEIGGLREQAAAVSPETLHELFDQLARNEELLRRAAQPRIVMEMTLLKLTQIRPVLSLEDIVSQLSGGAPAPFRAGGGAGGGALPGPATAAGRSTAPPPQGGAGPRPEPDGRNRGAGGPPADPKAALFDLADFAARSEPTLSSALRRARARLEGNSLVITLRPGGLARSFASPEKEAALSQLAGDLWGGPVSVRIGISSEEVQTAPKPTRADLTALADHPVVQEAMEVFEAEMVDLKPVKG